MSQEKATVHPIAPPPATPPTKPAKARPTQILPSGKITIAKQLGILRAYAATSGQNAKPVKTIEVADVAKTQASTISTANPFFVNIGLLQKTEGGFVPSAEVLAFAHAYEWDATDSTASHKLAPLVAPTWFAQEIIKKLSFGGGRMKESEAITSLAQYASAPPDCKNQVRVLIDYLEVSGIVQRDGDDLKRGSSSSPATHKERHNAAPPPPPPPDEPEHREVSHREPVSRGGVNTAYSHMAGGNIQFNVTVRVDMKEFAGWKPERISAFFAGMAQVLAAKGAIEQQIEDE
ncbi:MAG TPA: hypothetical protein VGC91_09945 [Pyrinomonadaceae bacterium]|jgi:hypothetical protein